MLRHAFEGTKCRENLASEVASLERPAGRRHEAALYHAAYVRQMEHLHGQDVDLVRARPGTVADASAHRAWAGGCRPPHRGSLSHRLGCQCAARSPVALKSRRRTCNRQNFDTCRHILRLSFPALYLPALPVLPAFGQRTEWSKCTEFGYLPTHMKVLLLLNQGNCQPPRRMAEKGNEGEDFQSASPEPGSTCKPRCSAGVRAEACSMQ